MAPKRAQKRIDFAVARQPNRLERTTTAAVAEHFMASKAKLSLKRLIVAPLPIPSDWAIVGEFLSALADRQTYSLRRNGYVFFGLLWGLPVPVVTVGLDLYLQDLTPTLGHIVSVVASHPFQLVFLLHPLLFAVLFGAMGTVRERKERRIEGLLDDLRSRLEELEQLNVQLRDADRLKDEFLSTISHELKTPLVTVRGYGEMLLSGRAGPLDDRRSRIVRLMLKNVDRQINLIDDLLNYIRIGAEPDQSEREVFDLREAILEARETFAPSIVKKRLRLEIEVPDEPLMVQAHRRRVEMILSNLLSNAVKFTDPGGLIRIESRDSRAGKILTWCSDTGCGIPEDLIPHIFERFRQADGSTRRKHRGTGLGLAIVKKIVEGYGCTIDVRSRVGEGTTFCFELPAAPAGPQGAATVEASEGRGKDGGREQGNPDH